MEKVSKTILNDSHLITELKLCSVRLIDNSKFPWIILIPKKKKYYRYFSIKEKRPKFVNTRNCLCLKNYEENLQSL